MALCRLLERSGNAVWINPLMVVKLKASNTNERVTQVYLLQGDGGHELVLIAGELDDVASALNVHGTG